LGFVPFTSSFGRPNVEGVLLPGIFPRTGTDVQVCRQAKFWFGGLHLIFSSDILRHNQRLPRREYFWCQRPLDIHSIYGSALVSIIIFCESIICLFGYLVSVCSLCKSVTRKREACGTAVSMNHVYVFVASEVHVSVLCLSIQD